MKKLICSFFNLGEYNKKSNKVRDEYIFQHFGIPTLKEFCESGFRTQEPIARIDMISPIGSPLSFGDSLKKSLDKEVEEKVNREDFKEKVEFPLLNVCLNSNDDICYIVLNKDNKIERFCEDGYSEYKIIEEDKEEKYIEENDLSLNSNITDFVNEHYKELNNIICEIAAKTVYGSLTVNFEVGSITFKI